MYIITNLTVASIIVGIILLIAMYLLLHNKFKHDGLATGITFALLLAFMGISIGSGIQEHTAQTTRIKENKIQISELKQTLQTREFKRVPLQGEMTNHPERKDEIKSQWTDNETSIKQTNQQLKKLQNENKYNPNAWI